MNILIRGEGTRDTEKEVMGRWEPRLERYIYTKEHQGLLVALRGEEKIQWFFLSASRRINIENVRLSGL